MRDITMEASRWRHSIWWWFWTHFVVNTCNITLFSHVIIGIDHGRSGNKSRGCCCHNSIPTVINPLSNDHPADKLTLELQQFCGNQINISRPDPIFFSAESHHKIYNVPSQPHRGLLQSRVPFWESSYDWNLNCLSLICQRSNHFEMFH